MKSAHKNWSRSHNGWKESQSKRRIKQKTKLAILIFSLIFLLLLFGRIYSLTRSLFQPFSSQVTTKPYIWDGSSNINMVVRGDKIAVFSYNPKDKKVVIAKIPDETYVNIPGGFGDWQVRSIYNLGQSEKIPIGNQLLVSSLTSVFGMPVDGYLEFRGNLSAKSPEDIIETMRQNPFAIAQVLTNLKTNLTPIELVHLLLDLKAVRFDKVKSYDLLTEGFLNENTLPDGTKIYEVDPAKIDSFAPNFAESDISAEQLSIAVFNTTNISGLAQKASRLISNIGGNVIISTSSDGDFKSSRVVINPANSKFVNFATYKKLVQIFGSDCQNSPKCGMIPIEVENSRAVINVILGEDSLTRF